MPQSLKKAYQALKDSELNSAIDFVDAAWLCAILPDVNAATPDVSPEAFSDRPGSDSPESPADDLNDDEQPAFQPKEPATTSAESEQAGNVVARGADAGSTRIRGSLISLPRVPQLPNSLEIERSLRSLARKADSKTRFKINEQATAESSAEANCLNLIRSAEKERWLDCVLVIECSPSMRIWQDSMREFHRLLWRLGAFHNLKTRFLDAFAKEPVLCRDRGLRSQVSQNRISRSSKDQLVIYVTDCRSNPWVNGTISQSLKRWDTNATVVLNVMDSYMWHRTALRDTTYDVGRFARPLESLWLKAHGNKSKLFRPVVGFTPRSLRRVGPFLKSEPGGYLTCFKIPKLIDTDSQNEDCLLYTSPSPRD